MKEVFILSAKRTPTGSFLGSLADFSATDLGSIAIQAATASVDVSQIDSVYMGNVLSAGLGQAPARQAAIRAGLPPHTDCTTVNKVCASGMKAVMIGAQQIQLAEEQLVVTGGMESMSNAPHYSYRRKALKLGHDHFTDGLLKDGLTDAFHGFHMGNAAEQCAREFAISRAAQNAYALQSYERAKAAAAAGKFGDEIVPVALKGKEQVQVLATDEDIDKLVPEKVSRLKPVFEAEGTITAANASNLNDGAAALLLASREAADQHGLQPLARIVAYADAATLPERFATAPALAIPKVLQTAGLSLADMDFIELNEAYAAVVLANQQILGLNPERLNMYGGAVAIGHPLGASGARILCTLLSVLRQEGGRYGLAAICNGGGGASAVIIENLNR
jgi:acetyl-CoA C-acetyltransferase